MYDFAATMTTTMAMMILMQTTRQQLLHLQSLEGSSCLFSCFCFTSWGTSTFNFLSLPFNDLLRTTN